MKKIKLSGGVGYEINANDISEKLASAGGEAIEVSLNSGGGDVFTGFEIYSLFANYDGQKTLILGSLVASAATYMICAFDEVKAQDISTVMIHNVTSWASGSAEDLEKEAKNVEAMQNQVASIMSKKMKITPEAVNELMKAETWYRGQEIVDAHLADSYIDNGQTNNMPIEYYKNQIKRYANRINKREEEDRDMTKDELLAEAKKIGLNLVDENAKRTNELTTKVNKLVEELDKAKKENANLKMSNELNTVFGVKDDKNLPRIQAETLYKAGLDMENIKKDPIMINLMAQKAAGETVNLAGKGEIKKAGNKHLNAKEY